MIYIVRLDFPGTRYYHQDMTNNDLKQLLDKSLKPLQQGINELKKGQEEFRKDLNGVKEDFKEVKKDQAELRKIVEERVLPPLTYIEATVKSYADRYATNEDHIGRLDKRLGAVEKNLGIRPPEELTIPRFD